MKLLVEIGVDLDSDTYELTMSDDEGRLSERQVPQAIAVAARVLEHVLNGQARRVDGNRLTLSAAPTRDGYEN